MPFCLNLKTLSSLLLLIISLGLSPALLAETVEQKVRLKVTKADKDVPRATYRYSINVQNCTPAHAQIKVY